MIETNNIFLQFNVENATFLLFNNIKLIAAYIAAASDPMPRVAASNTYRYT